jgi:L-alanine-DL-glutamate epimerase-like enolase superfamily enzyme
VVKVTAIEAIPFEIPFLRPFAFASGIATVADHVLVRVHTDEGIVGHAEAPPRPYTYGESPASIVAAVHDWFAPALRGEDPFAVERIRATLAHTVGNHTAKAAVDIAMWDIVGQAVGQPCHRLLGGYAESVAVTHMLGLGEPGEMVDEAVRTRDTYGITAFKVKVGRTPFTVDVESVRALRAALGDDAELYLDANRGWRGDDALRALAELSDAAVAMLEEPGPADDLLTRRRTVERSPVPIVGDESCTRAAEVARLLLDRSCDMVSVKTSRTGFTDSAKIVGLCEGLGAGVVLGNQIDGSVATLAGVAFAAAHQATAERPAELSAFIDIADCLLAEPPQIVDGRMAPPQQPGLGVAIDEDKVARYRVDR